MNASPKTSIIARALIAVIIGVQLLVGFAPRPAYAQWAVTNPDIFGQEVQQQTSEWISDKIESALLQAVAAGVVNLGLQITRHAAIQAAIWVASGGEGGGALFDPRPVEQFIYDSSAMVASQLIDQVASSEVANGVLEGFNVYVPDDPEFFAYVQAAIAGRYTSDEFAPSEVNFIEISENWSSYLVSQYADDSISSDEKTINILSAVGAQFDLGNNEFSSAVQVYTEAISEADEAAMIASERREQNSGFIDVTNEAGYVGTPADLIRENLYAKLFGADDAPFDILKSSLGDDNVLLSLGLYAGSTFTNELINQLLYRLPGLFGDYFNDFEDIDPFDPDSYAGGSLRDRVADRLESVASFRPLDPTDFNMLSELATCPSTFRGTSRRLFNCAMDSSFVTAVSNADAGTPMTVQEAIDADYLNGDWSLIPASETAQNQDTKCYTYGFCHSNLVKLRKARIIPIGWELAANSSANDGSGGYITLQEAIDKFHECNSDGELDDDHPYCHLVDPNWVLRYPETQCRTLAYGQVLQAPGTENRAEECVDIVSCVDEDGDGECTGGYGYCVNEKNVWRFPGDECPAEYAGCTTFENEAGESVDYIINTVDFGDCTASNDGCLWYATQKLEAEDEEGNTAYDWPVINNLDFADEHVAAYKNRLYFNGEVGICDEESASCAEFIVREDGETLNIIPNPTFELDQDDDDWPDAWLTTDKSAMTYSTDDSESRTGNAAIDLGSTGAILYQYGNIMQQSRFYTLSFYAKSDASANLTQYMLLSDEEGNSLDLSSYSYAGDCTLSDFDSNGGMDLTMAITPSEDYERYECTFTVPSLSDKSLRVNPIIGWYADASTWIDDVQLEQDEDATSFHVGLSDSDADVIVAKAPPSYLGCTGSDDDAAECANYAQVCSVNDVGCQLYTPANGDPSVTGIVSELDECPSVCSGYDTFKQESTNFEAEGEFPVYFIPESASTCNETAVGCDEFTNLSTEEREYFTYIRSCVTNDQADDTDGGAVYYTWEGSDEGGFQLRNWFLLESDMGDAVSVTYDSATTGDSDSSGFAEVNVGLAPCTSWTTLEDGIECTDDADGDGLYDTYDTSCDEYDDVFTNPNCRGFYDDDANVHYRDWSESVTVNDECVSYRKTEIAGADATEQEANCEDAGGYYDSDLASCRFYGYAAESTTCASSDAGCRRYTGGRSNNSRQVLEELFEDDTLENWEAASSTLVTLSAESVAQDGHSLKSEGETVWSYLYDYGSECSGGSCASTTSVLGGSCDVSEGNQYCGTLENELYAGKTYTLSFWARGSGTLDAAFDIDADTSALELEVPFDEDGIELSSTWEEFRLGPLDMNEIDYADFGEGAVLVFDAGADTFYIDNIVLREGEDQITVIKESWVTPAVCDQNLDGETSPQYHLGCSEYTDVDEESVYLKSFSRLCDEDAVGCKAYYSTAQSESRYTQLYNGICYNTDSSGGSWSDPEEVTEKTDCHLLTSSDGTSFDTDSAVLCTIIAGEDSCLFDLDGYYIPEYLADNSNGLGALRHIDYGPDTTIVNPDQDIYMIVDEEDLCSASAAGCTELGLPTFAQDQSSVEAWESVYLMNDPDLYEDMLCTHEQLFCAAFDAGEDGLFYFKEPGNQLCEYKTDITVGNDQYDGWFREDTTEFCYGTGYCSHDSSETCTLDSDCRAGSCTVSGDTCYQDLDCGSGDSCTFADDNSASECIIDDGDYIENGIESGIWRNGDDEYTGWVGLCSSEFDGCSEFQDLMDYEEDQFYGEGFVESYSYLDNANLETLSLLPGRQACVGQVSLEWGCALFYDTKDTSLDYSATATYIASQHADELFGDEPYDLVDPITCDDGEDFSTITMPSGETVDLCANRCVYANADLETESSGITPDAGIYDIDELYTFGTSCYVDSDCANYYSDVGDVVEGECLDEALVLDSGSSTVYSSVPRLENDTNRVLAVQRDRTCSEWLAASGDYTVWDEDSGSYRQIVDAINLCTKYSQNGNCIEWDGDDPVAVLDAERYASRDVSWYGEEYSSYAIPDSFPVQHLSQVNVAASEVCTEDSGYVCSPTSDNAYTACSEDSDCTGDDAACISAVGVACSSDSDCDGGSCEDNDEDDYRLAYVAGECSSSDEGNDCTVGYCSDDGNPCLQDDECSSGAECIQGLCYAVDTDSACSSDDDCSDDEECRAGSCIYSETYAYWNVDGSCSSFLDTGGDTTISGYDTVAYPNVQSFTGTCLRSSCVVSFDGSQFERTSAEDMTCRAQPEINSPFPTSVVEEWVYVDGDGQFRNSQTYARSAPYSLKSGYQGVNTCADGEDCVCAYSTLSSNSGPGAHISYSTDLDELEEQLLEDENLPSVSQGISEGEMRLGICQGGDLDGALCLHAADCQLDDWDEDESTSKCDPITKVDQLVGLEGYCLERDGSINLHADQDEYACLTWFPVDQLQGATDLYAKYKTAGFYEDVYMCSYVEPFVNLRISNAEDDHGDEDKDGIACADIDNSGSWGCTTSNSYDALIGDSDSGRVGCWENAECPEGYFAVVGQCNPKDKESWETNYAAQCKDAYNDCPYICVPEGSNHDGDPDSACEPPSSDLLGGSTGKRGTDSQGNDVYSWVNSTGEVELEDLEAFNNVIDHYKDCALPGVRLSDVNNSDVLDFPHAADTSNDYCDHSGTSDTEYRCLHVNYDIYPACSEVIKISDSSESYAWTHKLNFQGSLTSSVSALEYSYDAQNGGSTFPYPYGASQTDPDDVVREPIYVASCSGSSYSSNLNNSRTNGQERNQQEIPESITGCSSGKEGLNDAEVINTMQDLSGFDVQNPEARAFINWDWEGDSSTSATNEWTTNSQDITDVFDLFTQLFAYTAHESVEYFVWSYGDDNTDDWDDGETYQYISESWDDVDEITDTDFSGIETDIRENGLPPTVVAVNYEECSGSKCEELTEGEITANNTNDDDIEADEAVKVTIKFYAYANKNQMPIRRVIVDWGDGYMGGSSDTENYYKNRRGLKEGQSASYCDDSEWGKTSESCDDTSPFNYTHTYFCDSGTLAEIQSTNGECEENDYGHVINSPCTYTGEECVFQPRVHVRDNWGWCAGNCGDGEDEGCYDYEGTIADDDYSANDQCDYTELPVSATSTWDPWIYYDEQIIVSP